MKKIITFIVGATLLSALVYAPVFAETQSSATTSAQTLIQQLKQQIQELQAKMATLKTQLEQVKQTQKEVKEEVKDVGQTLKLLRQLRQNMTGEDIKTLQELLATDPDIYPEGHITGYFGKLTEKAIRKFQKKSGIEETGTVGPKTLAKLNEILKEGAGSSGKVPPGLLVAPGIREKLGYQPQPLPGQELPQGIQKKLGEATTTPDTIAPVISGLMATGTAATSTRIDWVTNELANSKVWYSTSTPVSTSATSTLQISSSDLVLGHHLTLSGLTATTTYYYVVSSADAKGNATTSVESSFTTLP